MRFAPTSPLPGGHTAHSEAIVSTAVTSPALDSPGSSHTGASCHGAWTPVDPWAASLVSPPNVGEQHPSLVLSFSEQLCTVVASTSPLPGFPPATHPGPGFWTLLCLFNTVHRRHPELMWDLQGGQKDCVGRPAPFTPDALLCSGRPGPRTLASTPHRGLTEILVS